MWAGPLQGQGGGGREGGPTQNKICDRLHFFIYRKEDLISTHVLIVFLTPLILCRVSHLGNVFKCTKGYTVCEIQGTHWLTLVTPWKPQLQHFGGASGELRQTGRRWSIGDNDLWCSNKHRLKELRTRCWPRIISISKHRLLSLLQRVLTKISFHYCLRCLLVAL